MCLAAPPHSKLPAPEGAACCALIDTSMELQIGRQTEPFPEPMPSVWEPLQPTPGLERRGSRRGAGAPRTQHLAPRETPPLPAPAPLTGQPGEKWGGRRKGAEPAPLRAADARGDGRAAASAGPTRPVRSSDLEPKTASLCLCQSNGSIPAARTSSSRRPGLRRLHRRRPALGPRDLGLQGPGAAAPACTTRLPTCVERRGARRLTYRLIKERHERAKCYKYGQRAR